MGGAEGGGKGSEVGRGVGSDGEREGGVWRRLSEKGANGEVDGKEGAAGKAKRE